MLITVTVAFFFLVNFGLCPYFICTVCTMNMTVDYADLQVDPAKEEKQRTYWKHDCCFLNVLESGEYSWSALTGI